MGWDRVQNTEIYLAIPVHRRTITADNILLDPVLVWVQPFLFCDNASVVFSAREIWGADMEFANIHMEPGLADGQLHIDAGIVGLKHFNPKSKADLLAILHIRTGAEQPAPLPTDPLLGDFIELLDPAVRMRRKLSDARVLGDDLRVLVDERRLLALELLGTPSEILLAVVELRGEPGQVGPLLGVVHVCLRELLLQDALALARGGQLGLGCLELPRPIRHRRSHGGLRLRDRRRLAAPDLLGEEVRLHRLGRAGDDAQPQPPACLDGRGGPTRGRGIPHRREHRPDRAGGQAEHGC